MTNTEQITYDLIRSTIPNILPINDISNKNLDECMNNVRFLEEQTILFREAGTGKRNLTKTGREHKIEFLIHDKKVKTNIFIDVKYRSTESHLYQLTEEIDRTDDIDGLVIFAVFGEVLNSSKFQRFKEKNEIHYKNVLIIDAEKELCELLKKLLF